MNCVGTKYILPVSTGGNTNVIKIAESYIYELVYVMKVVLKVFKSSSAVAHGFF